MLTAGCDRIFTPGGKGWLAAITSYADKPNVFVYFILWNTQNNAHIISQQSPPAVNLTSTLHPSDSNYIGGLGFLTFITWAWT